MLRIILLSCAVFLTGVRAFAQTDTAGTFAAEPDMRMARFFAGVSLIKSAQNMGTMDKAERLRELTEAVGVTVAQASEFLDECKSDPELWKVISESVLTILTEVSANTAAGGETAAPINKKGE